MAIPLRTEVLIKKKNFFYCSTILVVSLENGGNGIIYDYCNYNVTFNISFSLAGVVHLAGILCKLPHGLVSLSLADNGITSKGMAQFCGAFVSLTIVCYVRWSSKCAM